MKAKDLKCPFTWEERYPCLHDGVFFVPAYCSKKLISSDWKEGLFAKVQPIHVEYCSGNGLWLIEKAIAHPEINWIGVDKDFERVRKIWAKMKNGQLTNLLIVCGKGETFSQHYVPDHSIEHVFINFPDPWPKKRHHKHRIVQSSFIQECKRTLKEGGKCTFVTDDPDYLQWSLKLFLAEKTFQPLYSAPHYSLEMPGYGTSFFETLWREKGKIIFYTVFTANPT